MRQGNYYECSEKENTKQPGRGRLPESEDRGGSKALAKNTGKDF